MASSSITEQLRAWDVYGQSPNEWRTMSYHLAKVADQLVSDLERSTKVADQLAGDLERSRRVAKFDEDSNKDSHILRQRVDALSRDRDSLSALLRSERSEGLAKSSRIVALESERERLKKRLQPRTIKTSLTGGTVESVHHIPWKSKYVSLDDIFRTDNPGAPYSVLFRDFDEASRFNLLEDSREIRITPIHGFSLLPWIKTRKKSDFDKSKSEIRFAVNQPAGAKGNHGSST